MKKMKQIMKDEEGLTLVELLAVVVIMAIIAGIAAVSISKVIQRSREDAQVSNVQQMFASANLYDIQEEEGLKDTTTLSKLKTEGTIKSINFVQGADQEAKNATAGKIIFSKDKKTGEIKAVIPTGSLVAGQKKNTKTDFSEEDVAGLTRDELFKIDSNSK